MRRARLPLLLVAATLLQSSLLYSKDPSDSETELRTLRLMLEKQSLQIDALTREVTRLGQLIEGSSRPTATAAATQPAAPQQMPAEPVVQPAASAVQTHVVNKGETLTAIAKQYKINVSELQQLNKIEDGRKLQAGQTLLIPAAKPEPPANTKSETQ
jgi:LysM repeat protein